MRDVEDRAASSATRRASPTSSRSSCSRATTSSCAPAGTELIPYGRDFGIYDHLRHPGFEALAREFMDRLAAIGITVAAFHTEYGRGMVEFALAPLPALAAADAAARAKLYLAELCEERGLLATFMARCRAPGTEGTSGAHLHQSLLSDGENAFAGRWRRPHRRRPATTSAACWPRCPSCT